MTQSGHDPFKHIKDLIDDLELCHVKAGRRVEILIKAIGEEGTTKGYKGRESGKKTPVTLVWQYVLDILTAWLSGSTGYIEKLSVGDHVGKEYVEALGEPTELKKWQVEQARRKIRAASRMYPGSEYHEMMEFPEKYEDCRQFRDATVETIIHDTVDGEPAEISLAAAIDHLEPCNWKFAENLLVVLEAINGRLDAREPFAAHGRNAALNPIGPDMKVVSNTLRVFCGEEAEGETDQAVLGVLGEPTPEKQALAAQLRERIDEAFG
jgi:hypothetical protein